MNRQAGIVCMVGLSAFLLCGMQGVAPSTCKDQGPSYGKDIAIGAVVVGAVVIGTVVLVEKNKHNHEIKGCVSAGPNGLQVENDSDKQIYTLTGVSTNVKVGDTIKVHGTKSKKEKGSTAPRDFVVEKMSKDYGPCKVSSTTPAPTTP